jgi:hypothetical protein
MKRWWSYEGMVAFKKHAEVIRKDAEEDKYAAWEKAWRDVMDKMGGRAIATGKTHVKSERALSRRAFGDSILQSALCSVKCCVGHKVRCHDQSTKTRNQKKRCADSKMKTSDQALRQQLKQWTRELNPQIQSGLNVFEL